MLFRSLTLALQTGAREATAQFFPLAEGVIDNVGRATVTPQARGVQISLPLADPASPLPSTLRGVVVLSGDRAYTIDAPLTALR